MSSKIAVIKDEYMYLLKYIYSIIFVKLACCINILCDIIIPLLVISDVTSHIHKKQKQYFDFIPNLYVEGAYALKFLVANILSQFRDERFRLCNSCPKCTNIVFGTK